MLDVIITASFEIVAKADRLITRVRQSAQEDHDVYQELDRLSDALALLEGAAYLIRRALETRPEIARGFVHATVQ